MNQSWTHTSKPWTQALFFSVFRACVSGKCTCGSPRLVFSDAPRSGDTAALASLPALGMARLCLFNVELPASHHVHLAFTWVLNTGLYNRVART